MSGSRGTMLVTALLGGLLAAIGMALLIALTLALLGLYLSGHNLSLWGYGSLPNRPAGHWPDLLLVGGSALAGLVTGTLLYRSLRRKRPLLRSPGRRA